MKKLFAIIGLTALLSCFAAQAQTNAVINTNSVASTNQTLSVWQQTLSSFSWDSLKSVTNYAIEPYMTYAPDIKGASSKVGGGALILYNLNNYVAGGIGIDYLGQFSLFAGDLTLKLPIAISKYVTLPAPFDNLVITPFTLGGVGTPMSGVGSSPIMVWDLGAAIKFGRLWGGQFNTGAAYGAWENAGDYSGKRYHIFVGWSKNF